MTANKTLQFYTNDGLAKPVPVLHDEPLKWFKMSNTFRFEALINRLKKRSNTVVVMVSSYIINLTVSRLLTAEIMLLEKRFAVTVTTGVCPFGADPQLC